MGLELFQNRFFSHRLFVAAFGVFRDSFQTLFDRFKVGENQLGCDGLDFTDWVIEPAT